MADTFKGIITADGKKRQLPYRNVIETPVSDETLSIKGAFADSKAVGDKFKEVKTETDSLKEDLDVLNLCRDKFNIDGYISALDGLLKKTLLVLNQQILLKYQIQHKY